MARDKEQDLSIDYGYGDTAYNPIESIAPEAPTDVYIPDPSIIMPTVPTTPSYGGGASKEIALADDDLLPYYLKVQVDIMIDSLRFGAKYNGVDVTDATTIVSGIVKKSKFSSKIISPDAVDLDSLIILVNEIKTKFNSLIDSDIEAGQR